MSEELKLVTELAVILISAGVFTVISKALKQPLILGYIVAGFLVGPNLGLFPQFSPESVHQWSELGIIFMLFALGLEFSFKKLLKIGSSALIMAGTKCSGMIILGLLIGPLLGFTTMESVFLGGMISMGSTAIVLKTYTEMGLKSRPYAGLLFGSLVFEDLIAVLLMVLLSTLAVSNKFSGSELLSAFGKLAFFLVLCFLVGIYVLPSLLAKVKRYVNDEILLITSIGLCFGMVVLANKMGFSSALGAFIMGCLLSETVESEHITRITQNIKDLFGAIFFVSVGMMVDPSVIGHNWVIILVITLAVICGVLVFSPCGVLLSGGNLTTAVNCGFSLTQLGEFSFIIAGVGISLGVMREFIYPVIIAVSVITIFATPFMIRLADPALRLLRRKCPAKFLERFDRPDVSSEKSSMAEKSEWKHLLKRYFLRVGLYSVLLVGILMASDIVFRKVGDNFMSGWPPLLHKLAETAVTLAVMGPFLYGLAVTKGSIREPARDLIQKKNANKWPILALALLRVILATTFVIITIEAHFDLKGWALLLIFITAIPFFVFARKYIRIFGRMEKRFLANYNEKETIKRASEPVTTSVNDSMSSYDVHIESVTVSPDFEYAGKMLREMPFRHISGANIVKVSRGSRSILIPSGDERIFPGDTILAVGTSEQLSAFRKCIEESSSQYTGEPEEFALSRIILDSSSHLTGHTLREMDLRKSGCMVISIQKGDRIITNPGPDTVFEAGDSVWLAGEKSSVEWYK